MSTKVSWSYPTSRSRSCVAAMIDARAGFTARTAATRGARHPSAQRRIDIRIICVSKCDRRRSAKGGIMSDVLVVIGAGGMGETIARRLAPGRTTLLADYNTDLLDRLAESMTTDGFDVVTAQVDVSSRASVEALAAAGAMRWARSPGRAHGGGVADAGADRGRAQGRPARRRSRPRGVRRGRRARWRRCRDLELVGLPHPAVHLGAGAPDPHGDAGGAAGPAVLRPEALGPRRHRLRTREAGEPDPGAGCRRRWGAAGHGSTASAPA